MRAFLLALLVASITATPGSAGTWEPALSFPPLDHVSVGADGTALVGWAAWNDEARQDRVKYALISPDGGVHSERTIANSTGAHGASFYGSVFDRRGNATLIFGFDDAGEGVYCCRRYEAAFLPRGGKAPVRRQRLEPGGRDRIQFTLAAGPRGERLGAWFVERKPWQPGGRVEVLEAAGGGRFGRPRTLAREPHLDVLLAPWPVVEADGTRWVFWSATEDPRGARYTALRAARRGPHQQRWRVRTLARADGPSHGRVNPGGAGFAVASHGNQILLMWRDCDGKPECDLRWRWRRDAAWGPENTLPHERSLGDWPEFSPAMGERSRATVVFKTCDPGGSGYGPDCTLHRADGRRGRFGASSEIGPGTSPVLRSNGRGDAMLVYVAPDDRGHTARAGSLTGPFGAPTRLRPDYQSGMVGFGVDDAGNAMMGFTTFDPDVGRIFRYRR